MAAPPFAIFEGWEAQASASDRRDAFGSERNASSLVAGKEARDGRILPVRLHRYYGASLGWIARVTGICFCKYSSKPAADIASWSWVMWPCLSTFTCSLANRGAAILDRDAGAETGFRAEDIAELRAPSPRGRVGLRSVPPTLRKSRRVGQPSFCYFSATSTESPVSCSAI